MDQRDLGKYITEISYVIWGIFAWVILSTIIIGISVLREIVLIPNLGRELGLPISGILVVIGSYAMLWHFMCCMMPPRSRIAYIILGMIWLTLTYGFEYMLNVSLLGRSATEICEIYCLSSTAFPFPLFVLIAIAPSVIAYSKGQFTSTAETVET